MPVKNLKWIYLILLSLVWGSSFILIKKGLVGLTALQLGSFRIIFAAAFLIIVGFKSIYRLKRQQWKWIVISGFLGSFFPVYLFAFAETEIDSAVASILNATTPLMTLIFGVIFFGMLYTQNKITGVIIGLIGTLGLIISGAQVNPDQNYLYSGLVVLAAGCYAVNVNILKKYMNDISALGIAAGNFLVLLGPALAVLFLTDFSIVDIAASEEVKLSVLYVAILGVIGTGIALIIFNRLIQISDPVFSSSVTYTIPVVGLAWGILDGEIFSWLQLLSTAIILLGVFIVNRPKNLYSKKVSAEKSS
ncbi:DMT family transporter [Antarcticibacterium flavum]|uniref:DMT family transporter n=1 Tax=Antarcticibacterium flavum TaxID=2058175 RepID=A0A5B7X437_9FLAO|nr:MULTISPECIES: DMT family transporter [Antarcticibacterium]MCM4160511.1 permease [Antarcticibacterium sp. W02-3]QCY69825.1 DMT family transporter [Antarcticibacterium flavum]